MHKALKAALLVVIGLSTSLFLHSSAAFAATNYSGTVKNLVQGDSFDFAFGVSLPDNPSYVSEGLSYGSGGDTCTLQATYTGTDHHIGVELFDEADGTHFISYWSTSPCTDEPYGYWSYTVAGTYLTEINGFPIDQPKIYSLTYSTSTGYANITGYWEASTTPYVSQRLSFWQFSATLGKESYQQLSATSTGYFNFSFSFRDPYAFTATTSTTTAPIYASFTLNASLDQYDETNYVFPYGGTEITNLDATSTEVSAALYNAVDFVLTPRDLAAYPEYPCDITSLTGCFKNALVWAFWPTKSAVDSFNNFIELLKQRPPAGYFYAVQGNLNNLTATGTAAFAVSIPKSLKTYIFNPFDLGIAGVLWFFFIMHFYHRLKHITI